MREYESNRIEYNNIMLLKCNKNETEEQRQTTNNNDAYIRDRRRYNTYANKDIIIIVYDTYILLLL